MSNTISRRSVCGFESHEEYNRLLKNSADRQFSFLQKFQETTQKNTKILHDNVTELLLWTVHPPSPVGGRPRASTRRCSRPRPCARPRPPACARMCAGEGGWRVSTSVRIAAWQYPRNSLHPRPLTHVCMFYVGSGTETKMKPKIFRNGCKFTCQFS